MADQDGEVAANDAQEQLAPEEDQENQAGDGEGVGGDEAPNQAGGDENKGGPAAVEPVAAAENSSPTAVDEAAPPQGQPLEELTEAPAEQERTAPGSDLPRPAPATDGESADVRAEGQTEAPAAAAPPPFFADPVEGSILIRCTARPEGFYVEQAFPAKSPCLVIYKRIETQLFLERQHMQLFWDGRPLADTDVASDVCVLPDSSDTPLFLDLEVDVVPEHLRILNPGDRVTRVIRTKITYGDDIPQKVFHVAMVQASTGKPFIGGWRHKVKPVVYHNATTQCSAEQPPPPDTSHKLSRTTQTQGVTRSCQTRRECGTQMPKPDLLVDESYDRVRVARPYFSADRLALLQTQKTIVLQAFVRGWRARRVARQLRAERASEEAALAAEDKRRKDAHEQRRDDEILRRTHPTTSQDFSVLHNELEAWRLQEVQRINEADISDEERRIAMMVLLKKQTKLLQTIDRLQIQATKENRFKRINSVLNKMSSAKQWGTTATVNVETPFTVRARELKDLYHGLQLNGVGIDERLDILLHVKWTVKEFECPLTREIVELIDREADLLNRGRREASLSGLRTRLSNLFLQFVETPEFNPEAAQFQRVPLEYTSRPLVKLDKK